MSFPEEENAHLRLLGGFFQERLVTQPGRGPQLIRRPKLRIKNMTKNSDYTALAGRILIAVLFLLSGIGKIATPAATQGYIAAMGLPMPVASYFASMTIEIGGSLLLIFGFQTRIVASGMALFTLATALVFHRNFADQNQMIHFLKNFAIMGGLLQVAAFGAGKFSLDARRERDAIPASALRAAQ
jgi:putative oxidoreductase